MFQRCSFLRTPLVCLVVGLGCIAAHELGHILAAYLSGGSVSEVSILSFDPHVIVTGSGSAGARAFRAMGGSLFLLTSWFAFMLAMPARGASVVSDTFSFFAAIELLPWIASSIIYPDGPASYDVWQFIYASRLPRWCVLVVAVLMGLYGCVIFFYKRKFAHTGGAFGAAQPAIIAFWKLLSPLSIARAKDRGVALMMQVGRWGEVTLMKFNLKSVRTSLLCTGLMTLPLMAQTPSSTPTDSGQTNSATPSSQSTPGQTYPGQSNTGSASSTYNPDASTRTSDRTERHDYGWIGLIGLAGLVGLGRRGPRTTDRDVNPRM